MAGAKGQGTTKTAPATGVRERILEAAFELLHEHGLQYLTQTRVAERAGVRQSHLTYYFPTRQALLEAVTAEFVTHVTHGAQRAIAGEADSDEEAALARLVDAVLADGHMRMFLAMIIEADADPALRTMMVRATRQIEEALADTLGGRGARERARLVVAAVWGLGLYDFVMHPSPRGAVVRPYVAWLSGDR